MNTKSRIPAFLTSSAVALILPLMSLTARPQQPQPLSPRDIQRPAPQLPPDVGLQSPAPIQNLAIPLDLTMYDLRLPLDQVTKLDLADLRDRPLRTADFEKLLATLGTVTTLYHANQPVRLAGDTISLSSPSPQITATRLNARGPAVSRVTMRQSGANIAVAGKVTGANIELDLAVTLSTATESSVAISQTTNAPLYHSVTLAHKGPITPNQPFLIIAIDAAQPDPAGKATVFIARATIAPPQPATAPAPSP